MTGGSLVVVDYGVGNIQAIVNMFKRVGVAAVVTGDPGRVRDAERLVLPGVGSFDHGVRQLRARGLESVLKEKVATDQTPLLGICLGMQLLARGSEEGQESGLGFIDAEVVHLRPSVATRRVPHMGWNRVTPVTGDPLFHSLENDARFYFVHSYHVACDRPQDVSATVPYGIELTAAVRNGRVRGVQFHPEKSHRFGMTLLKNFVELC